MNRNKIIITSKSIFKGRLALLIGIVLVLAAGALVYELGLSRAGFNRMDAVEERAELDEANAVLEVEIKTLQERIAVLETAAKIDREAYRAVEEELIELQSRILEQREDIEFYKGIVNEDDGAGLRIQDFEVVQGFGQHEFSLSVVLAQAFRIDRKVSGSVEIKVEGLQRGTAVRLGLDELGGPENPASKRLSYSFKYFQDIKAPLVLPADFVPERVHVIVQPKGKTSKTVEEFFIWKVKPS